MLGGPWQRALLNPIITNLYTFATSAIGGRITVRELVGAVKAMRKDHGAAGQYEVALARDQVLDLGR